jgi:hypothetical protein
VLLLRGSREEVPMLQEIQAATNLNTGATVGTTLRQLYALCEAASRMVSVDSGPGHRGGTQRAAILAATQSFGLAGGGRGRSPRIPACRPGIRRYRLQCLAHCRRVQARRLMMAAAEFRGDSDTIAHPRGREFGRGSSVRFVPRSKGS